MENLNRQIWMIVKKNVLFAMQIQEILSLCLVGICVFVFNAPNQFKNRLRENVLFVEKILNHF